MARGGDAKGGFRRENGRTPRRKVQVLREGPRRVADLEEGEVCEHCRLHEAVGTFDVVDVETALCDKCSSNPDMGTQKVKEI